jgi:HD-GYP domain-containing protein (c-di-GMP phosphodiesterase class II)
MLNEVREIEPQLKQILYGCVEHVQATKAALYLSPTKDLTEKKFELVTSYQFNDAARKLVSSNDDLVDRLAVKRNAFFVNGVGADMRFSEMLFRQGTDRLLVTPLYARGRLVGFIDMRDKAGRKPFDAPDLEAALRIAEQVVTLLSARNLFGLAPIPVSLPDGTDRESIRTLVAEPVPVILDHRYDLSPPAVSAIESARSIMTRRQYAQASGKRTFTEDDLAVVRLLLPAALAIPGATLASFTAIGQPGSPQATVAIATVTDDAIEMLQSHLKSWLRTNRYAEVQLKPSPAQLIYPFGAQVVPIAADGISTILSAPVNPQSFEGLVLTVAFERTPEAQAQGALTMFLRQIEQSVETAIAAGTGRSDRILVAEKLLEPDFQKYPELLDHCREVSMMSQRLATLLDLPPQQIEVARIAGLVHDVGLRLLDYDRLYRRPNLTAEELRGLAEHPVVGAAIVEPLLGPDVAQAVLRHHERVDGKGYPSRMSGDLIPLSARIIQVCDAWVAMTSNDSYRVTPLSRHDAAQKIREAAGSQFDEAVVARFLRSLNDIVG